MRILLSFINGVLSAAILAFAFSFKPKGGAGLAVGLLISGIVTVFLRLTGTLPFNALNVFTVGILGVPGLIAIMAINALV